MRLEADWMIVQHERSELNLRFRLPAQLSCCLDLLEANGHYLWIRPYSRYQVSIATICGGPEAPLMTCVRITISKLSLCKSDLSTVRTSS